MAYKLEQMFNHTPCLPGTATRKMSPKDGRLLFGMVMALNETQLKLINAADQLLRENGLARVTTREIAHQADVAEGLLYHHFRDKAELIHEVVVHRLRDFHETLDNLPFLVGQNTVAQNLTRVLEIAYDAQHRITPIVCGVFSDHQLRTRIREIIRERQLGPQRSISILADYLAAEQKMRRIRKDIVSLSAAKLLLASSFNGAMIDQFLDSDTDREGILREIQETVRTVLTGLNPSAPKEASKGQVRITK